MGEDKKPQKKKVEKKSITFRFPVELVDELDRVAEEYGFRKTAVAQKAIKRFLEEIEDNSRLF